MPERTSAVEQEAGVCKVQSMQARRSALFHLLTRVTRKRKHCGGYSEVHADDAWVSGSPSYAGCLKSAYRFSVRSEPPLSSESIPTRRIVSEMTPAYETLLATSTEPVLG
ncbi:hypothetical protein CERZMDRAFT_86039 [Cercospora zeae-maydis SCOH1-5]|uniref:Uncharacterized protein n=1 Tax=Cercospora zeae-maydis SCOH1-5 TaxID=717836 RepID=A0A6A6FBQ5_9PEZI|nr:hypothetical protein CERZMDRAFT_86039 [Cercospora zeae-maydis SCOH1-5]